MPVHCGRCPPGVSGSHFSAEIDYLLANSVAPSTMKVYNQVLQSFGKFRNESGVNQSWSIPLQDIIDFIAYLFKSGLTHSSINCYISGLSFHNKLNNLQDNTNSFVVRKVIEGVKRVSICKKYSRLPISRDLLGKILSVLNVITKSQYGAYLFRAAFSLCFHGMFRVGELTVSDSYSLNHAVKKRDVKFVNGGLEVFFRSSKTDQFGSGVTIHVSSQLNKQLCPVAALAAFLPIHSQEQGLLFCHLDGSPLSKYQFSAILKPALSVLGVTHAKISSHSFRIGMATQCAIDGYSDDHIKKLGRWKSGAYLRYIRIPKAN